MSLKVEQTAYIASVHCDACDAFITSLTRQREDSAAVAVKSAAEEGGTVFVGQYRKEKALCAQCVRRVVWAFHQRETGNAGT